MPDVLEIKGLRIEATSYPPGEPPRDVVLVDDVFTTGATVSSAARALKRAGAADVTVLTFAMALAEPI